MAILATIHNQHPCVLSSPPILVATKSWKFLHVVYCAFWGLRWKVKLKILVVDLIDGGLVSRKIGTTPEAVWPKSTEACKFFQLALKMSTFAAGRRWIRGCPRTCLGYDDARRLDVARSPCSNYRRRNWSTSRLRGHGKTGWPIRSHDQECTPIWLKIIELSITKVTLTLAPNSSILNKPHPPPLILARQPVSWQPLPWFPRSMQPRPQSLYRWTPSLKIKYMFVIYSGRQRMAR
jgi:hypothetical protein